MKNLLLKKVEKSCIVLITLLVGSFGYAQITQRGVATTATSTTTSLVISKPVGLTVNDLMIVNLAQGNNNSTAPTATGWTLIDGRSLGGASSRYGAVLYKIATAADVSASNFVFTMGASTNSASGAIVAFYNINTTTPFDVSSGTISVQASQTSVSASSKTTTTANTAILMLGQAAGSNPTWSGWTTTSPGALTELFDVQQNSNVKTSIGGAWFTKTSIGATGTGGATLFSAQVNGGILLALRECNTITLSSTVGTDVQTKCINTAISNITYATTGATGATFSGLPAGVTGNWASNVATISGTPTVSGTFNYTITLTGGCSARTATGTITVNPNTTSILSSAVGTDNQTKCINTALTNITYNTTNATGATFSGLPTGITGNWAANVVTISGTPSVSGSFPYTVTLTGTSGCGTLTSSGTITVNPTPSITLGTQPSVCNGTTSTSFSYSSVTNGADQYSINWTPSGISAGLTNVGWTALSGGTIPLSGLTTTAGTYPMTITVQNSTTGCSNAVAFTTVSCGTAAENGTVSLSTTNGTFSTVDFASYGTPNGSCGSFTIDSCDATNSTAIVSASAIGQSSFSIVAGNGIFGDPCGGIGKRLYIQATSSTFNLVVNSNNTIALSSGAGTNIQTRCINNAITNITYTSTVATGATFSGLPAGVTGTWAANVVTISGTPTASGTYNYTVTLTGGCGPVVTASGTITVNPILTANVTITASPSGAICAGTSVTFTASPTNGGTTPTYQWKINGTNVAGQTGSTFTTTTLSNTNVVTVVMTSNATPCLAGSPVTSAGITMSVSIMPTVTGTTPAFRTGPGTLTLGATASIGTISWYANSTGGTSLGTGTSFTTPVISTTTTYYVEVVNGACTSTPRTAVVATIKYPEIDVQGNAVSIVNNDITPSTTDWTDFGTDLTRTFTIYNTGNASLILGAVTIVGTNASDFTVTSVPNNTVAIGSSTTFTITFSPSAVGISTATVTFTNNDTDENPYSFDIQATAIEQEIDVMGNATSIVNGDSTPSTTDWTDFSNIAGTRTFTISNLGNLELNIGAITIGGANASDFTVTSLPSTTIPAFGTTTFTVAFNPSAINTRTAIISIANDDSTENPYDFTIQGFGIIPEIDIQGNATSIPDSTVPAATTTNWTDFSSITATRTFTIYNNGNLALNIGAITFTGTNASEFTVTTTPSASVAAFGTTTFTVTFAPTAVGTRTAQIHIANNDSNEDPYDFNLQGTGTIREINIQGNGLSITSGDTVTSINDGTDFGPADINLVTVTKTFTIMNTGSIALTISNPTITGANASEFSITANPSTLTIGSNSSTTFQVTFNPSIVFTRVATINIVNNDSDENPYTFGIQGTGLLDNDGDGIDNSVDQDDDNDGILDNIECGTCVSDPFVNGSFENTTPLIGTATWGLIPVANVTGWQTTPENVIEVWSTGMNGGYGAVPAAAGNQFVELNANVPGTLYQTFCLNGAGGSINWAIKHRGRAGTDVAYVKFGTTLATAQASIPVATMSDGKSSWGSYSGTYAIPVGQTNIVLAFQAGSTATGNLSIGNLIDDIQIIINQNCIDSDADGVADLLDVDDENDGIPDIEEAGFKIYSGGKSTMDRSSSATWTDTNANGLNDYIEYMITAGTYLSSIPDTDGDGVKNYLDLDSDNDTAFDIDEANLLNGDGDINGDGKGDGADSDGDGLLNLFDNSTNFGTTTRAYAQDTDANSIPDYLDLDSNDDGITDIQAGLYGSFDANGDGKIDGSGDADGDGITDTFDTNNTVKGSPRDLNRKLYLDFDGRNDYAEDSSILGGLSNATLMAWIDLNAAFSSTGVVVGQDKFQIKVSASRTLQAVVNGTTLTFGTALTKSRWYHVAATFGGGYLTLYLNGKLVGTPLAVSGSIAADATKLTLGRNPLSSTNYFKGKIDEVRVFNTTLTATQIERMVYQEIQNTASQVQGAIVPKDIGSLPFANLLRYYRMDAYKDDIVDNLTTPTIDSGTGMKLYNHKVINVQQAPMPFTTVRTGTFATAINDATKDINGADVTAFDYSIIQVKHNITETSNSIDLAMFVDLGVTITMNNDTKLQNDWYLKLDGKIDLNGKSQLVQTTNSDLDITSSGSIERDQQGSKNIYNYNYWSSPVGAINNTSNNNPFTIAGVMKDGTTATPQNINWTYGLDGSPTSPITVSSYWIYKFQNLSNAYANWQSVGSTGTLNAAQGFTMKGSGTAASNQNYTFVGKPNNGTITTTVAGGNLNLCGNPYASALDANAFISANTSAITGTLYFWEHASNNATHNIQGYQGGYSSRNLTGGTGPVAPADINGLGTSAKTPGRFIPVSQGFFVVATPAGGTITFDNSQRAFIKEDNVNSTTLFKTNTSILTSPNNNEQYNNNSEDSYTQDTYKRVRLGITSTDNYHRQILLGFMENNATDAIDLGYDGLNIDNQPNDMYFINNTAKLNIQGVGYFDENKVFPIGIKNKIAGNVNIMIDNTENMDANQSIYILDNTNGEYHDITSNPFTVQLPQGLTEGRFSLTFKDNNNALANNNFNLEDGIKVAYINTKNTLNIKNNVADTTIEKVILFNLLGQSIVTFDVKDQNQQNIELPIKELSSGTYIVKIKTDNGDITKKIIFN
jgi:hypothetical protein